jgi:hypothetical protein
MGTDPSNHQGLVGKYWIEDGFHFVRHNQLKYIDEIIMFVCPAYLWTGIPTGVASTKFVGFMISTVHCKAYANVISKASFTQTKEMLPYMLGTLHTSFADYGHVADWDRIDKLAKDGYVPHQTAGLGYERPQESPANGGSPPTTTTTLAPPPPCACINVERVFEANPHYFKTDCFGDAKCYTPPEPFTAPECVICTRKASHIGRSLVTCKECSRVLSCDSLSLCRHSHHHVEFYVPCLYPDLNVFENIHLLGPVFARLPTPKDQMPFASRIMIQNYHHKGDREVIAVDYPWVGEYVIPNSAEAVAARVEATFKPVTEAFDRFGAWLKGLTDNGVISTEVAEQLKDDASQIEDSVVSEIFAPESGVVNVFDVIKLAFDTSLSTTQQRLDSIGDKIKLACDTGEIAIEARRNWAILTDWCEKHRNTIIAGLVASVIGVGLGVGIAFAEFDRHNARKEAKGEVGWHDMVASVAAVAGGLVTVASGVSIATGGFDRGILAWVKF